MPKEVPKEISDYLSTIGRTGGINRRDKNVSDDPKAIKHREYMRKWREEKKEKGGEENDSNSN